MTYGPIQTPLGARRARADLRRSQLAPDPAFAAVTACALGVVLVGMATGQTICP